MGWISRDYECCGESWEDLVDNRGPQTSPCPKCGKETTYGVSMPKIAVFSIQSKEQQQSSLKKRSAEHTAQTLKKDGPPTRPARKKVVKK
jgi:hypothetical protein